MNTLESYTLENPFGKADECAKLVIYDTAEWFILSDTMVVDTRYTFSAWIKSDTGGSLTVGESYFLTTSDWVRWKATFTADDVNLKFIFDTPGTYYIYHPQLEVGTIATDWTPATEDMATAEDVDAANETIVSVSESVSALDVKTDNIFASVTETITTASKALDSVNADIEVLRNEVSMKMTSEAVNIQIQSAMEKGASKVVTNTGFTFDDDGMTVEKSGSEMKTQITEDGMVVYQNDEAVLTANNTGVDAKNLHATTYLIIGGRSRFENYGSNRTGCFWIGG